MPDNPDILILGAGAAGLAAASELAAHNKSVLLLEARPRIGGRIDTLHDPAWPLPIERGAEFIHGKPKPTLDILHASGCLSYDITDTHHLFTNNKLKKQDDFFDAVEKVRALTQKPKQDLSYQDCIKKFGKSLSPQHKAWARSYIEGFDAADPSTISSHWLADVQKASEEIEGDRLARIVAGYDQLPNFLRTGIPPHKIELNTTVTHISYNPYGVTVHATRPASPPLTFTAKQALITLPASILQTPEGQPGHITFDPPLPEKKREAINSLRTGPVVKVLLRAKEPFWEKLDPDLNFFHDPNPLAPFPTWWTTLPIRTTILTGWAGGPAAARLAGRSTPDILSEAAAALSTLLKIPRRKIKQQVTAAHVCDWQSEPLSRGAYSYAAVNGAHAAADLARPLHGKLFFAGEATHSGLTGTVPAALASAHRAAREILRHKG
jgi:monoamine oxidase